MGQTLAKFMTSLEATDANTIKLVLREPYGLVLDSLGKIGAPVPFMMPERIAKTPGSEQVKEIIGSGPYKFRADQHEPGVKIVLEKFADYKPRSEPPNWASGGKIAKMDKVEMLGMPDAQTQVSALIRGEVDYLERVPADLLPLFDAKSGAKAEVVSKYGFQAIMRMNHLQPPFDNVKVRQAIAKAIDRSMYAAVVAGDPQFATDCAAIFGCGMPYESKNGIPARDVAGAKALLRGGQCRYVQAAGDAARRQRAGHRRAGQRHAPGAGRSRLQGRHGLHGLPDLRHAPAQHRSCCAGRLEPRPHHQLRARPGQSAQQSVPGGVRSADLPPGAGRPIPRPTSCA